MKFKDIKLDYVGDEGGAQRVWTLTKGGATDHDYYYVNEECADLEEVDVGWYSDKNFKTKADDVDLPYGQGVALVAAKATTKVVFAGQVEGENKFLDITGGSIFNFTGNCMPIDRVLGDFALIYKGDEGGAQRIWTLTKGGATEQDYYYVNEECADLEEVDVGWYDSKNFKNKANDVEIKAGDGFAVVAGKAIQLMVPSPLDKGDK